MRRFSDFVPGEIIQHVHSKTVTEGDNNLFSLLTMNHHPVHLDFEYAKNNGHIGPLVVGTYVLSLVVGISVMDISWNAKANLEYNNVIHKNPVYVGDTISASTEVLGKKLTKSGRNGVVEVKTIGSNQSGQIVIEYTRKILLKND